MDKAAAVFSLKLDNGHKLLCPWTDNICEESLALFPPTPPSVLIRNYEDCITDLLQLSSLPKISSYALGCMKKQEPRIEEFLKEQSSPSVMIKGIIQITEGVHRNDLEGLVDDSDAYYEVCHLCTNFYYLFLLFFCGNNLVGKLNTMLKHTIIYYHRNFVPHMKRLCTSNMTS